MILRVEHLMLNCLLLKHRRKQFGFLNGDSPYQYRLARVMALDDLFNHSLIFLALAAVDAVGVIRAAQFLVGRNTNTVEAVNLLEFRGFRVSRSCHARELVVQTEIILEGDGRKRLVFARDLYALFSFDRLVKAVRPAPAGHHAPGKFIDDDHLAVAHDIINVLFKELMRLNGLEHVVPVFDRFHIVKALDPKKPRCFLLAFIRQGNRSRFFIRQVIIAFR